MPTKNFHAIHYVYIGGWQQSSEWERRIKIGFAQRPEMRVGKVLQKEFPGLTLYQSLPVGSHCSAVQIEKWFKWKHEFCREAGKMEVFHLYPQEARDNLIECLFRFLREHPRADEKTFRLLMQPWNADSETEC
jgi:hypothetical protein